MLLRALAAMLAALLAACGGSLASEPAKRVLVIGDSITVGVMPNDGATLRLRQDLAYTAELAQAGDVFVAAHGGATTVLARAYLAEWPGAVQPDVLVIHLGINDAVQNVDRDQALMNVMSLMDRWPAARTVLVAPMRWAQPQDAWLSAWAADLRALAAARGAGFVDLYAAEAPGWRCSADRHPCAQAHREIGRLVLAQIGPP